jgi:hypothetical protein
MNDPLAQFRKKPSGTVAEETPPPTGVGEYLAFDAKDRVARLQIRLATENALTHSPGYCYLLDVVYSGTNVTEFVLVFTFMMVLVRGTNLQPVAVALQMSTAEFIQQFDASRWPKPKDAKAPFIEFIEVISKENGPSPADGGKSGNSREQGRSLH